MGTEATLLAVTAKVVVHRVATVATRRAVQTLAAQRVATPAVTATTASTRIRERVAPAGALF